jgi:phage FluMu protein Com
MQEKDTPQIRCGNCNKLLGKGTALDLEIKCPRCGCINHVRVKSSNAENQEPPNGK